MAKLNQRWFAAAQGTDYGQYVPYIPCYGISEPRLRCPACKDDHIRLTAVECLPAGQNKSQVIITNAGLSVRPTERTYGRDKEITLWFCCEQGHELFYSLKLHKGDTFIEQQARE